MFALRKWIAGRGGNEAAEAIKSIAAVRLFIERYGDSRFESLHVAVDGESEISEDRIISNRAGWRRGKDNDETWLILPEVFRTEVCAGLDPTTVAKVLADRGMLLRDADQYQRPHRIRGKLLRVYTITAAILSSSDTKTAVTPVTPVTANKTNGFSHSESEGDSKTQ
jgi:putative DNA primase/helicase